jgi:hypothetical protein
MVLVPSDFLGQFCAAAKSGHHPEKVLAKFGYFPYVSFKTINRIFLYSWLPIGTYHNNLVI